VDFHHRSLTSWFGVFNEITRNQNKKTQVVVRSKMETQKETMVDRLKRGGPVTAGALGTGAVLAYGLAQMGKGASGQAANRGMSFRVAAQGVTLCAIVGYAVYMKYGTGVAHEHRGTLPSKETRLLEAELEES
jgi:Hypoxia induced protein conserved region